MSAETEMDFEKFAKNSTETLSGKFTKDFDRQKIRWLKVKNAVQANIDVFVMIWKIPIQVHHKKNEKISPKTPILAFLGQFFRFSREIFEFGIFHMAYPKTTDKNQALRKNPCPKKPLQLKL